MDQDAHHVPGDRRVVEHLLLKKEGEIEEGAIVGVDVQLSEGVVDELEPVLAMAHEDREVVAVEGPCDRRQVDGYRNERRQQQKRCHARPRIAYGLSKRGTNWRAHPSSV